ncbi:MAG: mechanosensitive ion channel domain-containing protein [Candidatus Acidiferrales bacterium]
MNGRLKTFFIVLLVLLGVTGAGMLLTSGWFAPARPHHEKTAAQLAESLVDQQPLLTAQQLAPLATTRHEQQLAQEALRLADQEVDFAFAAALRNAVEHPPAPTPETRKILKRINDSQASIQAGQDRVAQLNKLIASAKGSHKDDLQGQLDLTQAQIELDQDELADAKEDLVRAGGDQQTLIQRMLDEHQASSQQSGAGAGSSSALGAFGSNPYSLIAEFRAWRALRSKENQLIQAQEDADAKAAELTKKHDALEAKVGAEKANKPSAATGAPKSNPAANSVANSGATLDSNTGTNTGTNSAANPTANSSTNEGMPAKIAQLRQLSEDQKATAGFDKQIQDEKDLSNTYGKWSQLVTSRDRAALHSLLVSLSFILVVGILIVLASFYIARYFAQLPAEQRRLHTLRSMIQFAADAVGILIILLIIFGPPSQLGTALALVGAGLTVALKDFIVGFLGWFVLMGKNGIRVGDWVEIDGVGGEVVEIGLLYTTLLETGSWTEAGQPTGRRVSFVNSYAIEGHFFNFSTSGQWLWDELKVFIPPGKDPGPIAEEMQKLVAKETEANAHLAEQEWQRVTASREMTGFSAEPSIVLRPTAEGIVVTVRYITRANERHEVRSHLYQAVIEILRREKGPQAFIAAAAETSAKPAATHQK